MKVPYQIDIFICGSFLLIESIWNTGDFFGIFGPYKPIFQFCSGFLGGSVVLAWMAETIKQLLREGQVLERQ